MGLSLNNDRPFGYKPTVIKPKFICRPLRGLMNEISSHREILWAWPKDYIIKSCLSKRLRYVKHILRRRIPPNDIKIISRLTRSSYELFSSLLRKMFDRKPEILREKNLFFYVFDEGVREEYSVPQDDLVSISYFSGIESFQKETGSKVLFNRVVRRRVYPNGPKEPSVWRFVKRDPLKKDLTAKEIITPVNNHKPLLQGGPRAPPGSWKHVSSPFCDCFRCEYCDLSIAELKSYDDCIRNDTTELWIDPRIMRNELRPLPEYVWGQV